MPRKPFESQPHALRRRQKKADQFSVFGKLIELKGGAEFLAEAKPEKRPGYCGSFGLMVSSGRSLGLNAINSPPKDARRFRHFSQRKRRADKAQPTCRMKTLRPDKIQNVCRAEKDRTIQESGPQISQITQILDWPIFPAPFSFL
jgi:hypothetical protein